MNTRIKKVLQMIGTFIGLPIFGVVVTLWFQQYFFESNKVTEEAIKLSFETISKNAEYYYAVKSFADLSEMEHINRFEMTYEISSNAWITDSIGYVICIPHIGYHLDAKNSWDSIYNLIKKSNVSFDRDIIEAIENVKNYIQENPFPVNNFDSNFEYYKILEMSGWNDAQQFARWKTLVEILVLKIERRLEFITGKHLIN